MEEKKPKGGKIKMEGISPKLARLIERRLKEHSAVVITGASSGIGEALVRIILTLAPDIPICNVSRSQAEIFAQFPESFSTHISCDLSLPEETELAASKILEFLNNLPNATSACGKKALLINNSGFGLYGEFSDNSPEKISQLIELNVRALTELCSRLIKNVSQIINVSSTAAWQACPYLAVYAASKSYVLSFSLSLDSEMRRKKIGKCLCVCPGPTSSNFFKAAGWDSPPLPSGFGHKSSETALEILRAFAKGKSLKTIGFINNLQALLVRFIPSVLCTRISAMVLSRIRSNPSASKNVK